MEIFIWRYQSEEKRIRLSVFIAPLIGLTPDHIKYIEGFRGMSNLKWTKHYFLFAK